METIGNIAFQDQRDPIFSAGGYELDTARVPWQGAASLKSAFTAGLVSFTTLPGYNKMYLMRWSDDEEPHWPTVTLEYQGCKSGSPPPVKADDGMTVQTVTTSVESDTYFPNGGSPVTVTISMDLEYFAQQTNYSWYSLSTPATTPIYNTARRVVNLNTTVFSRRYKITDSDDTTLVPTGNITSVDTATFTQLSNSLTQSHKLQEYKVEDIVPGALWRCMSVVNYQFTGS